MKISNLRKWRIFLPLLCAAFLLSLSCISYAFHKAEEHNKFMEQIFFNNDNYKKELSDEASEKLQAIEDAAAITIDQAGGTGQSLLTKLNDVYKITGIETDINKINVPGGALHRKSTHCGWDYVYINQSIQDKWKLRKTILVETVKQKMGFKKQLSYSSHGILPTYKYDSRLDSFCALIYYVHLAGDRESDSDSQYYSNRIIMELGGRHDTNSIIDELLKHCGILFRDQKTEENYKDFVKDLNLLNSKIKPEPSTDEEFKIYSDHAEELSNILKKYLPGLLKEEKFFRDVFL